MAQRKKQSPAVHLPYFDYRDELTVQGGIVLRGERVVIQTSMRKELKAKVHAGHFGTDSCLRRDVRSWEQQSKRSCQSCCQSGEEYNGEVPRRQRRSLPGPSEPPKHSSGGPHKPCSAPDGQKDQTHCSHHVQPPEACSHGTQNTRNNTWRTRNPVQVGDALGMQPIHNTCEWKEATDTQRLKSRTCDVTTNDGTNYRQNRVFLRSTRRNPASNISEREFRMIVHLVTSLYNLAWC